MTFKKIQLSSGLILKIGGGVLFLTIGGFFVYNQILLIQQKKSETNYNLLSNCRDGQSRGAFYLSRKYRRM